MFTKPEQEPAIATPIERLPQSLTFILKGLNVEALDLHDILELLNSRKTREQLLGEIAELYGHLKPRDKKSREVAQAYLRIAATIADPKRAPQLLSEFSSKPSAELVTIHKDR